MCGAEPIIVILVELFIHIPLLRETNHLFFPFTARLQRGGPAIYVVTNTTAGSSDFCLKRG